MKINVSAWCIRNPIPSVLLFIMLTLVGLMSFKSMRIQQFPDIDPLLKKTAVRAAHYAEALSTTAERALREHGKEIIEREFVQERLAEAAGDLYALIACLSRANTRIRDQGAGKAKRDILLTRTFGNAAWRRIRRRLSQVEKNQDANLAQVSDLAYEQGGFGENLIA